MKHFAIGDGNKRGTLPDRYQTEMDSNGTAIFWDPSFEDFPIRVSALSINPEDPQEKEAGFWAVIDDARGGETNPRVIGNKAVSIQRAEKGEDDSLFFLYKVGMGNSLLIVSLTVPREGEGSDAFLQVRDDVDTLIESLVEREPEHAFTCHLPASDFVEIEEVTRELAPRGLGEGGWERLQRGFDIALERKDLVLAGKVGLIFGEMLRREIPTFRWYLTVDDWGCARSLNFGDSGISLFPENIIMKRVEKEEPIVLREFASDTIETIERVFRESQTPDTF